MNRKALHSRLGGALMNARHRAGQTPSTASIERMSIARLAAALRDADAWDKFAQQHRVVQVGDTFYDRNGMVGD